jgi:putative ABC transport system ATP-binding protein
MKKDTLLELKNISKTFGQGDTAVRAVRNVSLAVKPGDLVLIKGPSGSGKTTLLTIMGMMMTPSSGQVAGAGHVLSGLPQKQKADYRLHNIGFIFQSFNLLPALKAWENVAIASKLMRSKNGSKARALEILDKLGIKPRANHYPDELSGGERQRVAIARALMNEPLMILADEPTANLDSRTGKEVTKQLCSVACRENKAVIIVSHDQRIESTVKTIMTIEDGVITSTSRGGHDANCTMEHGQQPA